METVEAIPFRGIQRRSKAYFRETFRVNRQNNSIVKGSNGFVDQTRFISHFK